MLVKTAATALTAILLATSVAPSFAEMKIKKLKPPASRSAQPAKRTTTISATAPTPRRAVMAA